MYGIINKSFKEYIISAYDEESWRAVSELASVSQDSFVPMRNQPDEVTERLLNAAVTVTEVSAEDHLECFGRFWMSDVVTRDYREVIQRSGETFLEFVENLNKMHEGISSSFLSYSPPKFEIRHCGNDDYKILYRSHRTGFTPFVKGILHELSTFFSTRVVIKAISTTVNEDGESSVISIEIEPEDA